MEKELMEFDQIIKRLDWLDEQHRKDKAELEALSDQLADANGESTFIKTIRSRGYRFVAPATVHQIEIARHPSSIAEKASAVTQFGMR